VVVMNSSIFWDIMPLAFDGLHRLPCQEEGGRGRGGGEERKGKNSMASVGKRTIPTERSPFVSIPTKRPLFVSIPTERPPFVSEVSANFLQIKGGTWSA
jgi:hypothetical protein